jgi:hypothetical protein
MEKPCGENSFGMALPRSFPNDATGKKNDAKRTMTSGGAMACLLYASATLSNAELT